MGASTVMLAEGEKLPDNVKAAIEDCGYTSIRDQLTYSIGHIFHIPAFPVLQLTSAVTKRRAGYSLLHDGSCVDAVRRSATPTLFIHGDSDTFIPPANMEKLFSAAACFDNDIISDAPARFCDIFHAAFLSTVNVVAEREERVRSERYIAVLVQP